MIQRAVAAETGDLQLYFGDDARREVIIAYGGREWRWSRRRFGDAARFKLERESATAKDGEGLAWHPKRWTLRVERASFPGRDRHDLVFTFEREPNGPTGFEPWRVRLATRAWPAKVDAKRPFGERTGATVGSVALDLFLGDTRPCLEALLPRLVAQETLSGFFDRRIETDGPIVLGLDRDLAWHASAASPTTTLFVLDFALGFQSLRIERTFGDDDEAPLSAASQTSKERDTRRLFAEEAPRSLGRKTAEPGEPRRSLIPGLYAEAGGPFRLPDPDGKGARFEFAFLGKDKGRLGAAIAIGDYRSDRVKLRAALRHWGRPDETVAGLALEGREGCQAYRSLAKLALTIGEPKTPAVPASTFHLAAVTIVRQMRPAARTGQAKDVVETRAQLTPSRKEHVLETPFGPIEVRAAPAVPPRTGLAARVPPILLAAVDRDSAKEVRELVGFEATLSLVSLGIRLPESHDASGPAGVGTERIGEHVTRLEFADAECRFALPALGMPEVAMADALVPLGPDSDGASPRAALVDLGRAKLTVLRPSDLLSLSYRFSGLLLELPRLLLGGPSRPPRILPSRGGPMCRAESPPPRAGEPGPHPTRDERPILVVEFPPQHVAERAYFRQLSVPDLPRLPVLTDEESQADYKTLRSRPGRGQDPNGVHRRRRIAARERLGRKAVAASKAEIEAKVEAKRKEPGDAAAVAAAALELRRTEERREAEDAAFRIEFERRSGLAKLPREQRIYVGPEFLDADARRIALDVLRDPAFAPTPSPEAAKAARQAPDVALDEALSESTLRELGFPDPKSEIDAKLPTMRDASNALELEKERKSAEYAEFRLDYATAYTEHAKGWLGSPPPPGDPRPTYRGRKWFANVEAQLPPGLAAWVRGYAGRADAREQFQHVTEARLSGPSRLAFRINCDDFETERAGGGLAFSLEALTDWGGMDLAVVRRAERLMEPNERGPVAPRWARTASLDDADILAFQGIGRGDRIAVAEDAERRGLAPPTPAPLVFPASRASPPSRLAQVAESARPAPDPFQTAIEFPFRLFLSPAQDSAWLTPNASVRRKAFSGQGGAGDLAETCRELWSATLAGSGTEAGLRAVWSPDFRPEAILSTDEPGAPPHGPYAPWSLPRSLGLRSRPEHLEWLPRFRTSLDAYDRHELVALSSLHGLPVLGRREANGSILGGNQFDPPPGYRLSGLFLDKPPATGREGEDLSERDFSAIYRPQPLSVSELALTALGGNINLDTTFTPPASARTGKGRNLFDAFSIERWRHRAVLGRDVLVEVVYKGFLFPIGHKATLVKVTERRFEAVPAGGPPVAVLIQRMFLRVGEPLKTFPAYDHPNEARRWPCERVTILTRRTPDLIDPDVEPIELKPLAKRAGTGRIFWPRTAPVQGAEVRFQMLMDAESAPVAMPLIFVDNTAANDAPTMMELVDWYNALASTPQPGGEKNAAARRLPRNGQPVRMATEEKPGDTSFESEWWDLKAEGRERRPVSAAAAGPKPPGASFALNNRRFERDPFMEGLDQPPFYPICDAALCRLTQVERFTGAPSVWAVAAYDGYYAAHGFGERKGKGDAEEAAPAGEVFLQLLKEYEGRAFVPIKMRMASADRSGGVGQPNLDVVGVSRATGPIGLAKYADAKPGEDPRGESVELKPPPKEDGVDEARKTTLESLSIHTAAPKPETMFPSDAKLLGLVPLSLVIKLASAGGKQFLKDQPKLKEIVEYGASGAVGAGAEARAFVTQNVLTPVEEAIREAERRWKEIAARNLTGGMADITLGDAYPQIGSGLVALRVSIEKALSPSTDDVAFFALLATVYEAGRSLVAAIGRILRDPLASVSEAQVAKLKGIVAEIAEVAKRIPELIQELKTKVADRLLAELVKVLTDEAVPAASAAWRRTLVALPLPRPLVPPASQERLAAALDKALVAALRQSLKTNFSLDDLARTLPAELRKVATATAEAEVKDALADIAKRLEEEGRTRLADIATPYLGQVLVALEAALGVARTIEEGLRGGPTAAVAALGKAAADIQFLADALLGDAALLRALQAADPVCHAVGGQFVKSFAALVETLLPPIAPAASSGCAQTAKDLAAYEAPNAPACIPPGPATVPGSQIKLGEACAALTRLVVQLRLAECELDKHATTRPAVAAVAALRGQLATVARRLAADTAAIEEEMARIADWKTLSWTSCRTVPLRAAEAVSALTAARARTLKHVREIAAALAQAKGPLQAAADHIRASGLAEAIQASLRKEVAEATNALAATGRAANRFLRAATLLASALEPGEGDVAGAAARKVHRDELVAAITAIADALKQPELRTIAENLAAADADLERLELRSRDVAKTWRDAATTLPDTHARLKEGIEAATGAALAMTVFVEELRVEIEEKFEQAATDLARRLLVAAGDTFAALEGSLTPVVEPVIAVLAEALHGLATGRDALLKKLGKAKSGEDALLKSILAAVIARIGGELLVAPCAASQKAACDALIAPYRTKDRLALEAKTFTDARADLIAGRGLVTALATLRPIVEDWRTDQPALAVIARQFASVDADFARSLILLAIDLKALRREIETRIRDLIPARVVLPYDLDNTLNNFPKDDPIFEPVEGTKLTLRARTTVHLLPDKGGLPKAPEFRVTGEVGPFAINLLGKKTFDVVTINFHGLTFQAGSGRSADFRVRFKDVKLGKKAEFLKPLQDFLSPKAGGFYLTFLNDRPGIEAGYGINLGVIGVGALSFSNVTLNAAARLPFDGAGEARFLISIGRADAPFLISSTIFGGGGYLALIADSRKIVGFEASFDYGGVAAFGFGPLQGMGRITMGIYLRKEGSKTSIGAVFFAGGSAHIACFGFSTSLCVRLIQNDGGPMYGSAVYTFSFSIGIDDIEFKVGVEKNEGAQMGGQSDSKPQDGADLGPIQDFGRVRYAANALQMNDAKPAGSALKPSPRLRVRGKSQVEDWAGYATYFDDGLRPANARLRPKQ